MCECPYSQLLCEHILLERRASVVLQQRTCISGRQADAFNTWVRWAFAAILVVQAFLSLFIIRNILP